MLTLFFAFATAMTGLACASLVWPDGPLAAIWRPKPAEFRQLLAWGPAVPAGFLALSLTMATTTYGVWRRARWGWALAVCIFAANGLSDAARALSGAIWEGLLGASIAALVVWWLTRRAVREQFGRATTRG